MNNFCLDEKFTNYQVVHATGIERDIIECCHNFCVSNYPNYKETDIYYDCLQIIKSYDTSHFTDEDLIMESIAEYDISYFAHDELFNFMSEISPVGCRYGSHPGDSTLGYWEVLDKKLVTIDFRRAKKLPYNDGYYLHKDNADTIEQLKGIDEFLYDNFLYVYPYTDLWDVLTQINISHKELINNERLYAWYSDIKNWLIGDLLPTLIDDKLEYKSNGQFFGFYSKE